MTCRHEKRKWYVAYHSGADHIEYLVSAFSELHLRHHLHNHQKTFIVRKARMQDVVRVFCGTPVNFPGIDHEVTTDFEMCTETGITQVMIMS